MTQETTVDERVTRTEDRVVRVLENMATRDDIRNMATKDDISNMATKEDIKILHDRLNTLTIIMVLGFIFSIGSVVLARLIG